MPAGRATEAQGSLLPVPPRVLLSAVAPGLFLLPGSAPSAGHTPSPCRAWQGSAPTCTCREGGSAGRGTRRRGKRAPVNPTQFIIRPEQLGLEMCLYQVSSGELHPRIGFERSRVPPAHLLSQPPSSSPWRAPSRAAALGGDADPARGCRELAPSQELGLLARREAEPTGLALEQCHVPKPGECLQGDTVNSLALLAGRLVLVLAEGFLPSQ